MSQDIFDEIPPTGMDGTEFAAAITAFKDAVVSGLSGVTRPTELDPGGWWVDTSADPTWVFKLWTGATDVTLFTIDTVGGSSGVPGAEDMFTISKTSADALPPLLTLLKSRIATNGQVLSGDVVGELQFKGKDDDGDSVLAAKIIFTASENFTDSAFGGDLSMHVVTEGGTALEEYLRLGGDKVTALKIVGVPALYYTQGSQTINANLQTFPNTSGVVKILGNATGYSVDGIGEPGPTKQLTMLSLKSGSITILHDSAGAAAVEQRFILPDGEDMVLLQYESATFQYSDSDERWYLTSAPKKKDSYTEVTVLESDGVESFTVPDGVTRVRLRGKKSIERNLAGGGAFTVLSESGAMWAWGDGTDGAIGNSALASYSSPVAVMSPARLTKLSSRNSQYNGGAIDENGGLWVWGTNTSGQLGDGTVTTRSFPIPCLASLSIKEVGFGSFFGTGALHTLILALDGSAYAVGENANGRLGDGTVTDRSVPVAVIGGHLFDRIAVGGQTSYAIKADGTAWAWGFGAFGQLGVGDVDPRSSPVAIVGGFTFSEISAFQESALGLSVDRNTVYAWGNNAAGQLGQGDVTHRSSPVAVTAAWATPIRAISTGGLETTAGQISCYVLDADGVVWSWGSNSPTGALGLGDTTPRSSPVAVTAPEAFLNIAGGVRSCAALGESGTLYAWGNGSSLRGRLGDGTNAGKSTPTVVLGGLYIDIGDVYRDLGEFTVTPGDSIDVQAGELATFDGQVLGGKFSEISIGYRG